MHSSKCAPAGNSAAPNAVAEHCAFPGAGLAQGMVISVAIASILSPLPATAFDQPSVNLGGTSFLDGGPPAGPGWYFIEYLEYYTADRLNDNHGHKLALPDQDINIAVSISQLVYLSSIKFAGGHLGWTVILPMLLDANVDDGLDNTVLEADTGVGDITAGPLLQFDPIMGPDGPRFVQRLEADFILPTGEYNRRNAINPGSNFWSFNPYWSGTFWFKPEWSISFRAHYLWNASNTDPNTIYGPGVSSVQAGQAAFVNFATEYAVTPQLRLGINGYWFDQFTDSRINGHAVSGRQEHVWAIGPGAVYSFSKENAIFLDVYFEQDVRNRAEGGRFFLRWAHHF